ncbi:MAG TPA: Wzz/FepE/Etk N-terminal domain-containing protein [Planctomycetota bacterium]|nr:Wzz/FepE/Etk N-terminal domain-containing protein [Planctomycetota bacterium]
MDARLTTRNDEPEAAEPSGGLSADQVIDALLRTRFWIAVFAVIGLACGTFMAVAAPNVYRASAKLMVRWGSREQTTTDSVETGQRAAANSRNEDIETEIQLLNAPVVYENAVKKIGAASLLAPYDPSAGEDDSGNPFPIRWFHAAQKWWFGRSISSEGGTQCCTDHSCPRCFDDAVRLLQNTSGINHEPGASVITVACLADNAREAKRLADALVEAMEERHRDFFKSDTGFEFLRTQMEAAVAARDRAATTYADAKQTCHVYDINQQRTNCMKELNDAELAASSQRLELSAVKAKRQCYDVLIKLAKDAPPETTVSQVANGGYALLQTRLDTLKQDRDLLLTNYTPEAEIVKEKELQITRMQERLKDEPQVLTVSTIVPAAQATQKLMAELTALKVQEKGIEAQTAVIATRRQNAEDALAQLATCEPDLRAKEKDYELKAADALRFTEAFDRYSVSKALDTAKMSNLRVVQAAQLPYDKFAPNRKVPVVMGLMMGLGAGFLLAFLRAATDRTLRSSRDVERILGVPVICTVPEMQLQKRAAS